MVPGRLAVFAGPMFSGKTDALIRRAESTGAHRVYKPAHDTRHPPDLLVSRSGRQIDAQAIDDPRGTIESIDREAVVAFDEIQLFDLRLVETIRVLRRRGNDVIAAGLDLDFRQEPFEVTAALLAEADEAVRMTASCTRCGDRAPYTQRFFEGRPAPLDSTRLLVGDAGLYEPRCERCWMEERGYAGDSPAVRPAS